MRGRRLAAEPAPPPGGRTAWRRWARACRGELPAEALPTRDREDLIAELHTLGWTDVEIAEHTKLSTYSTARIRDRLGLTPNRDGGDPRR